MTLGQALAAQVRIIVWCKSCDHRAEPDIATQVAQHGSGMPVPDWARLFALFPMRGAGCRFRGERGEAVEQGSNRSKKTEMRCGGTLGIPRTVNQSYTHQSSC